MNHASRVERGVGLEAEYIIAGQIIGTRIYIERQYATHKICGNTGNVVPYPLITCQTKLNIVEVCFRQKSLWSGFGIGLDGTDGICQNCPPGIAPVDVFVSETNLHPESAVDEGRMGLVSDLIQRQTDAQYEVLAVSGRQIFLGGTQGQVKEEDGC